MTLRSAEIALEDTQDGVDFYNRSQSLLLVSGDSHNVTRNIVIYYYRKDSRYLSNYFYPDSNPERTYIFEDNNHRTRKIN